MFVTFTSFRPAALMARIDMEHKLLNGIYVQCWDYRCYGVYFLQGMTKIAETDH